MRWFPSNRAAKRIIASFAGIVILLFISSLISLTGFNKMARNFRIIYYDRLIPSLDLAHMLERQYVNRFYLEEAVTGIGLRSSKATILEVKRNNHVIDSLLSKYVVSHTLKEEEKQALKEYNKNIRPYRNLEVRIFEALDQNDVEEARRIFKKESYSAFERAANPLIRLQDDQLIFGTREYKEIDKYSRNVQIVLIIFLCFAVAIAIALGVIVSQEYLHNN